MIEFLRTERCEWLCVMTFKRQDMSLPHSVFLLGKHGVGPSKTRAMPWNNISTNKMEEKTETIFLCYNQLIFCVSIILPSSFTEKVRLKLPAMILSFY